MLSIYNSLTRKIEPFTPIQPRKVRMYVCGITVYDYLHVGHARMMVVFDMVARYLRARGYDVTYVRNITDIDDKIIKRAAENGETIDALTARFIDAMNQDLKALNVAVPTAEPRATQHIPQIIDMTARLVERGYAYQASNGDVYYRVRKFADYGALSGRSLDDLQAGARVEITEQKQDPLDFVLWKTAKPGEPQWPSPWGPGRPGWHIECSAMSTACLGHHFDIHGGGMDLKFPHHENEIAQSEGATGEKFVNLWMHNGFVRINEEKMSKSSRCAKCSRAITRRTCAISSWRRSTAASSITRMTTSRRRAARSLGFISRCAISRRRPASMATNTRRVSTTQWKTTSIPPGRWPSWPDSRPSSTGRKAPVRRNALPTWGQC
jgi:cysteinyl-tRNA synthetase